MQNDVSSIIFYLQRIISAAHMNHVSAAPPTGNARRPGHSCSEFSSAFGGLFGLARLGTCSNRLRMTRSGRSTALSGQVAFYSHCERVGAVPCL